MNNNSHSFAEILASNLNTIQGQCWNWKQPPVFGSLVTVETPQETIFAIISNITIESSDPVRQPIAYQKTHEELLQEQPQIFEFLETNFQAIIVGHKQNGKMLYHLPSSPPQIHSFISYPEQTEAQSFFAENDYLQLLLQQAHEAPNFHELLFAILKEIKNKQLLHLEQLHELVRIMTSTMKADYMTIKTFINRVETLLKN